MDNDGPNRTLFKSVEHCPHCDEGILAEHRREKKKKYTKITKFCTLCGRLIVCRSYRKADR